MKVLPVYVFFFIMLLTLMAFRNKEKNEIEGAWQLKQGTTEQVLIFVDDYFTHTVFDKQNKKFIETRGGAYTYDNGQLTIYFEFDTKDKERVGIAKDYKLAVSDNLLSSSATEFTGDFKRIDKADSGLAGLWRITGRKGDNGNIESIHQRGTRKTVKILTSTRFQWAAIDPGTKAFMGTGGGTYSFKDGKYTEQIEFFSRDSSRVGASLSFEGKIENDGWHHSGLSSRGEPIYEVWSRQQK